MNNDNELCREFVKQAKSILSHYPQIRHAWTAETEGGPCSLEIPLQCEGGFPILIEAHPGEIRIRAGAAHIDERLGHVDPAEFAAHILGLVRDLLGPGMRIREQLAGGKPTQWAAELWLDGKWLVTAQGGRFFRNWFARREERIFQNTILPARGNPVRQVHDHG